MADYSFSTNAIQEAAISDRRLSVNAERAANNPPLPPFDDNAAFVDDTIRSQILGPVVQGFIEKRLQQVANAYRTGSTAQRQAVDQALGL